MLRSQDAGTIVVHQRLKAGRAMTLCWIANAAISAASIRIDGTSPSSDPTSIDFGYELRKDMSFGPWEPDVLTRAPSSYIRQLYFDTVSLHSPAILCAVQTAGADHVLFGSDFPPVPISLKRSVEAVTATALTAQEKEKVLGGNAAKLLGLTG